MASTENLIKALRRLKVETNSLACFGCGYEHNCSTRSTHGCAIIREAIDRLASMMWIDATVEVPDMDALHADYVLGIASGRVGNTTYDDAVCMVYYNGDGRWYLEENGERVSVSYWMPLPVPPEVPR